MPNTNEVATPLKKIKDFNEEEKAAILARAKKIEAPRVAKEFNTTWQVVVAVMKQAQKATKKNKTKTASPKSKAVAKKTTKKSAKKTADKGKRSSRFSEEEKLAILKRASEIGVPAAASEAGISKWTIFQWKKVMKKAGIEIPKSLRKKAAPAGKVRASKQEAKSDANAPKLKAAAKGTGRKTDIESSLEFENAILRDKVATLTAQVERLRAAVAKLA
ncbi:MAG: hypothetical protein IJS40_02805 [Synergistaceae bacterium]|nr:hypothetical protein [Synergistaceae bacterium]